MKITFIRPNMFPRPSTDAMQPLSFAYLKSVTPNDVQTVLYDERIESIPLDETTDLVALSVETYTARRAYQLALHYRQRGVRVVMGGYHPTLLPDEARQFADSVVRGDAENQWERVIADFRAGRLQPLYESAQLPDLTTVRPDRSVFRGKKYAPIGLVQYSRGCKYRCDFCSIHAFYGSHLRQRPIGDVVAEIQQLGRQHILFVDDNLLVDVPRARELFQALAPLRVRWSCQVSIDIARDPDLVHLMRRSGCLSAVIGFESLNRENLFQMKKGWSLGGGGYDEPLAVLRAAGIMVYGTFVFGYDHDTVDAFDEAVDFAIRHQFYLANFNPLTPTPGTPLYDRLQQEHRLIYDRWWIDPRFRYGHATFHPRGMTAEQLTEGCYRARLRFNSPGSIVRRAAAPRTNMRSPYRLGLFLLSNCVSRREIRAKQNSPLGAPQPLTLQTQPTGSPVGAPEVSKAENRSA